MLVLLFQPRCVLQVMRICPEDTVLTLTSGGCNALNLLLNGAGHVVSVDCNPAQSSLLELKAVAIQQLEFEDVWQLFGEGRHPHIERLFETRLAPFLSQKAFNFWSTRLWYFKQGLYYQGGMVSSMVGDIVWAAFHRVCVCVCVPMHVCKSGQRERTEPVTERQREACGADTTASCQGMNWALTAVCSYESERCVGSSSSISMQGTDDLLLSFVLQLKSESCRAVVQHSGEC